MATLNINSLELVSSVRTAGANSPVSSADYNETQREMLVDLSALAGIINDLLIPYFSRLSDTSGEPTDAPVGLEGRTIFSDTSDLSDVFFNAVADSPLTVGDSIRLLRAMITTMQNELGDLDVEVQSLESRISSAGNNNLTNVVQQLRNFYNALNTIVSEHTIELQKLQGIQELRVTTPSINPSSTMLVPISWPTAYTDDNYSVSLALESGTGNLHLNSFIKTTGGAGIQVLIINSGTTAAETGVIHVIGQHD